MPEPDDSAPVEDPVPEEVYDDCSPVPVEDCVVPVARLLEVAVEPVLEPEPVVDVPLLEPPDELLPPVPVDETYPVEYGPVPLIELEFVNV